MFRLVPEVYQVVQQCHPCQVKDQKAPKQKEVHQPSIQAGAPFQVWSMDILGPLRAILEGHRYLLMLKDVFNKWFEAIPLRNTTIELVLRALQMYARFGHPLQVHTDNATYFLCYGLSIHISYHIFVYMLIDKYIYSLASLHGVTKFPDFVWGKNAIASTDEANLM